VVLVSQQNWGWESWTTGEHDSTRCHPEARIWCLGEDGWTHGSAPSELSSVWSLLLADHPCLHACCLQLGKETAGKWMLKFGKSSAASPSLCSMQPPNAPVPAGVPSFPWGSLQGTRMQVQSARGSPGTALQQSPGRGEESDRDGRHHGCMQGTGSAPRMGEVAVPRCREPRERLGLCWELAVRVHEADEG